MKSEYFLCNPRSIAQQSESQVKKWTQPFDTKLQLSLEVHCTHLLSIFCPGINLMETVIFPTMTLKHP